MKRNTLYRVQIIISLTALMVFFQNCSNTDYSVVQLDKAVDTGVKEPDIQIDEVPEPEVVPEVVVNPPVNDIKEEDVVCDPFSHTDGDTKAEAGIKADLYYIEDKTKPKAVFNDFVTHGIHSEKVIFMNDINVPTRRFSTGFATQANEILKKSNGENLVEWFALSMKGRLQLAPGQAPGDYQFATLSDDGSILYIQPSDSKELSPLISADGHHSTKFSCAASPVKLEVGKKVDFKLDYFQGPREHIAMILMYRPYDAKNILDPLCGTVSISYFHDSATVPSTVGEGYKKLLSRGWKPVPAANFALPEEIKTNPCASM
jgi:hypothetical protein